MFLIDHLFLLSPRNLTGVGVFAGASGSAVFDQTLNEYSLFENKWIITLYEYWDNPLIESILDNSRIVFN